MMLLWYFIIFCWIVRDYCEEKPPSLLFNLHDIRLQNNIDHEKFKDYNIPLASIPLNNLIIIVKQLKIKLFIEKINNIFLSFCGILLKWLMRLLCPAAGIDYTMLMLVISAGGVSCLVSAMGFL